MASIITMIESCIEHINHSLDKLKKSLLLEIWQLGKELYHCSPFRNLTLYEPLQMTINKTCCLKIYLLSHHLPESFLYPSSYFLFFNQNSYLASNKRTSAANIMSDEQKQVVKAAWGNAAGLV